MNRITNALFLSDLHLGWIPLLDNQERLLIHLPAAVGDAAAIILNGDIIDTYRVTESRRAADLIASFIALCERWRADGRQVIYIEGNHDTMLEATGPFVPDRWTFDFQGANGEEIRVLHGHRFSDLPDASGAYERLGRRVLYWENVTYSRNVIARSLYPFGVGWLAGAIGYAEDRAWRPGLLRAVAGWGFDQIVHGHYHFGPGEIRLGRVTLHRSGAWVSAGHRGTVDRILRYRAGRWQRLGLVGSRWVEARDGR